MNETPETMPWLFMIGYRERDWAVLKLHGQESFALSPWTPNLYGTLGELLQASIPVIDEHGLNNVYLLMVIPVTREDNGSISMADAELLHAVIDAGAPRTA